MKVQRLLVAITVAFLGIVAGNSVGAQSEPSSPLAEYVGLGHNPVLEREIYDAEETERQNAIQKCMQDQGMPYVPLPPDFNVLAPSGETGEYFGFVASFRSGELRDELELSDDPNIKYAESLEEKDRLLYFAALFGSDWQSPNQSVEDYTASCTGAAYEQTPGLAVEIAPLRSGYMDGRPAALESDPEVSEATQEWTQCMSTFGIRALSREDMLAQLEGAIEAQLTDNGVLGSSAFNELLDLEKEMYEANQSCEGGLVSAFYDAVVNFDAAFLDKHRVELARFHRELW